MKKLSYNSKVIASTVAILGVCIGIAYAAQSYRLVVNSTTTISEWGVAARYKNTCTADVFVPTKTSAEWSAFRSSKPACVTGGCYPADIATYIAGGTNFTGYANGYVYQYTPTGSTCATSIYACGTEGKWLSAVTPYKYCDDYGYATAISGTEIDTCDSDNISEYTCTSSESRSCVDIFDVSTGSCCDPDPYGGCLGYCTESDFRSITCRGGADATGTCIAQSKVVNTHTYSVAAVSSGSTILSTTSTGTTVTCSGNTAVYTQLFSCSNTTLSPSGTEVLGANCGTGYTASGTTCVANTRTVACGGSVPLNATAKAGHGTYPQTYVCGGTWSPTRSWTEGATTYCGFTCDSGYGWNGTSCASGVISGTCDNPNYGCLTGTFVDDLNCVGSYYKWHCNGINGGTSATCQILDSGCSACFPAGTKVNLPDGTKQNIETIKAGDKVESYDEKTGKNYTASVERAIVHDAKTQIIYTFILTDGTVIEPNSIHPVYEAISGKYFRANELYQKYLRGEKIELQKLSGEKVGIKYINPSFRVIPVYNLHVDGIEPQTAEDIYGIGHNYYVDDVLVHNKVRDPYTCLEAGTKILMADGTEKNIEDIQVGEKIVTYNEILKQNMTDTVLEAIHNKSDLRKMYTITLDNGGKIRPNANHSLFEVNKGGYQTIDELYERFEKGEVLRFQDKDGKIVRVVDMASSMENIPVYNLHVAGIKMIGPDPTNPFIGVGHSYYANGVLSHNAIFWIDQSDLIDSLSVNVAT